MATDDQQILVTGTAPAPATWLVPGNGQITPRSVFAHYDGSAAAASFFPTLKVISDAGQTVGIYRCAIAVAAGGSADVSWFPGLGGVTSGSAQALIGARIQTINGQTIADDTKTDLTYDNVYFDTDGMANLGSDARILTVNTPGVYLVTATTVWPYLANAQGRRITGVVHNGYYSASGVPDQSNVVDERMPIWAHAGAVGGAPRTTTTALGIFAAVAGDFFASGVFQISGGNASCGGFELNTFSALLIGTT